MRLYKTNNGIVIEKENKYYPVTDESWETFINDDNLFSKMERLVLSLPASTNELKNLLAPIGDRPAVLLIYAVKLEDKKNQKHPVVQIFTVKYMKLKGPKCFLNPHLIE